MSLPLRLRPLVVPRLVPVGVRLPDILQYGVDEGLADENAEVDHQVGVHRPKGTQKEELMVPDPLGSF